MVGVVCRVSPRLWAFSWSTKEGAAYREAPLPFMEKNYPAYTQTHRVLRIYLIWI